MFKNYLLTAYKVFMRRKLFTAINLVCIVLTLVVLMVITALLQNAFYPSGVEGKSERFVQVVLFESKHTDNGNRNNSPLGFKLIERYLKPMRNVEAVSAVTLPETVSVYQEGRVSAVMMRRADAQYWQILDFKVLAGRVPDQSDVDQGRYVAVLNASTAKKLFPGQSALQRTVNAGGQTFRVIGVVEDALHLNALADIWVPVTTYPSSDYRRQLNGNFAALILARSAADIPAVQHDIERIAKTVVFDDPKEWNTAHFWGDTKVDVFARILLQSDTFDSGATMLLTVIAVLMLLFMLLPALNLVNLNIGRILERSTEIGVRKAFGATSAQLVAQLMLENVLLCLFGGLLGLACAQGVLWWLEGSGLIPYLKVQLNLAVFGYGLLITLVFGLLSGVLPAWKMSRLDPVHALKGAA